MDPITLGIIASIVTILAFLYMLFFGQRGLIDWLEKRRQKAGTSAHPVVPLAATGPSTYPVAPPTSIGLSTSQERIINAIKQRLARGEYRQALLDLAVIHLVMGNEEKARLAAGDQWVRLRAQPLPMSIQGVDLLALQGSQGPYFIAALLTYQGEAMSYQGQKEAIPLLREAISTLEKAELRNGTGSRPWQWEHILGRAYNDLGHIYWTFKNYDQAVQEYLRALPHLKRSMDESDYADTLKNLGYIYALQGKQTAAEILCRDALEIFHRLEIRDKEALSLNTLGLVHIAGHQPYLGEMRCQEALRISEPAADERSIGLACNALGHALRDMGSLDVYPLSKAVAFFHRAEHFLTRSLGIFTMSIKDEPIRLVEAYNELGCTYRDWAALYRQQSSHLAEAVRLEAQAQDHLQNSGDLAAQHGFVVEQVDTLEDLAELRFNRKEHREALGLLEQVEEAIPKKYLFRSPAGLPHTEEPISEFWAVLGKANLLRGHIALEQGNKREALWRYTMACTYFDLYSEHTILLDFATHVIHNRLHGLDPDELAEHRRYVQQCAEKYGLTRPRLLDIFDDTLVVWQRPTQGQD